MTELVPNNLTEEQLRHEIDLLRQLVSTRLDGMAVSENTYRESVTRDFNNQATQLTSLKEFILEIIDMNDKRYDEREKAGRVALDAALISQDKAVTTAFNNAKDAVSAALSSAYAAVSKAETSADKRFDSLKEKTDELSAVLRDLIPRAEGLQMQATFNVQLTTAQSQIITLRQDLIAFASAHKGSSEGQAVQWGYIIGAIGVIGLVVGLVLKV